MSILLDASNPFWDPHIITLIDGIKNALPKDPLIILAKQIAATFSLIYIAFRAYNMISGDGKLEIMPLFRPFIISLAILNISTFMAILESPGTQASKLLATNFDDNAALINALQDQKIILHDSLLNKLTREAVSMQTAQHISNDDDTFSSLENITSDVGINLTLYSRLATVKMEMMFQDIINNVAVGVFKGIAYCLFFITLIIEYILSCLGPLALAFSIAGAFKDSWIHWAGKVIAVSFYNAIGFIVLNISCSIIDYGFQQEVNRLLDLVHETDEAYFINSALHVDSYLVYVFIAIVVAIAGIACTPLISTWFISTTGGGEMAKSLKQAPGVMVSAGKTLIGK